MLASITSRPALLRQRKCNARKTTSNGHSALYIEFEGLISKQLLMQWRHQKKQQGSADRVFVLQSHSQRPLCGHQVSRRTLGSK